MIQLIINGTVYPETTRDKYICEPRQTGVEDYMSDGTLTTELSYTRMVIDYSYDYFAPELKEKCLADLRMGAILSVEFLPRDGNTLVSGNFKCTRRPVPTFAFSQRGEPFWHGYSFTLEEVVPHA